MSAHDSPINQHGANAGAEGVQKVQKEAQQEAQMQKVAEELANIMSSTSPQKQHLFLGLQLTAAQSAVVPLLT